MSERYSLLARVRPSSGAEREAGAAEVRVPILSLRRPRRFVADSCYARPRDGDHDSRSLFGVIGFDGLVLVAALALMVVAILRLLGCL